MVLKLPSDDGAPPTSDIPTQRERIGTQTQIVGCRKVRVNKQLSEVLNGVCHRESERFPHYSHHVTDHGSDRREVISVAELRLRPHGSTQEAEPYEEQDLIIREPTPTRQAHRERSQDVRYRSFINEFVSRPSCVFITKRRAASMKEQDSPSRESRKKTTRTYIKREH